MIFGPKRKIDPSKYILWTHAVHLTNPSCYLHGPFNFDSYSDVIIAKQHIALTHWEYILTVFILLYGTSHLIYLHCC